MESALICLYAHPKLKDNPLSNGKCNCLIMCTSKLRIVSSMFYILHIKTQFLDIKVFISVRIT